MAHQRILEVEALRAIGRHQFTRQPRVAALARSYPIEHCRLEPKADAALLVLITELLEGASLLGSEAASVLGMEKLAHALGEYPKCFDHPDWISPPLAGHLQTGGVTP